MSDDTNYVSDIDKILADFSSFTQEQLALTVSATQPDEKPTETFLTEPEIEESAYEPVAECFSETAPAMAETAPEMPATRPVLAQSPETPPRRVKEPNSTEENAFLTEPKKPRVDPSDPFLLELDIPALAGSRNSSTSSFELSMETPMRVSAHSDISGFDFELPVRAPVRPAAPAAAPTPADCVPAQPSPEEKPVEETAPVVTPLPERRATSDTAKAGGTQHFSDERFRTAFAPKTAKMPADTPKKTTAPVSRPAAVVKKPPVAAPVKRPTPTPPLAVPKEKTRRVDVLLGTVFALLALAVLLWVALNVHPTSNSAAVTSSGVDMVSRLDVYLNNAASDALGELAYIPKIYKIGENDTVAPMPDAAKFGTVSIENAAQILPVIQKARDSGLLDGQDVVFDPNAEFYWDSDIQYYCDDTILVICWKELIDGNTCSCVEVKIADASQFRRKIADDTYGSSNKYYASTMYRQTNAVVAMNADFYQFRDFGIVAYQRQLYRFSASNYTGMYSMYNCIDNCFVTADGNFLFMHKGENATAESVQQFMEDNDVLFTIAFGPILVENDVVQTCDWYPAGEPTTGYSRAGIGQYDKLHYFYMSLNHSADKQARWTVNQFAQHIAEKGVHNAYGLDGGQTSEIVFQDKPYNYIDYGNERLVSDIIYFATAIPSGEVGQ